MQYDKAGCVMLPSRPERKTSVRDILIAYLQGHGDSFGSQQLEQCAGD